MKQLNVLVLNSGSSSIKFSLYLASESERMKLFEGAVNGIETDRGKFSIKDHAGKSLRDETPTVPDLNVAFHLVAEALKQPPLPYPSAIGHRVVSGGPNLLNNQLVTHAIIDEIERHVSFAPLHIPIAVSIMRKTEELFPGVPNFVCLDNFFHRTMPEIATRMPIPEEYAQQGVRRYGAHGLSYESIIHQLQPNVPSRLIVAHLGNGASISAIKEGKCIDTSMGLTPTGGLISGTRTGDIDPGVLIYILRKMGGDANKLESIADEQSGLLGMSGLTNDMRDLREAVAQGNVKAKLAVDKFAYTIKQWIGSFMAILSGLDMLVFTGGIGENDSQTRLDVCSGLEPLGIVIDPERNDCRGEALISKHDSPVAIRVIPPLEDLMIVNHVYRLANEK
jgi:acetate kinase